MEDSQRKSTWFQWSEPMSKRSLISTTWKARTTWELKFKILQLKMENSQRKETWFQWSRLASVRNIIRITWKRRTSWEQQWKRPTKMYLFLFNIRCFGFLSEIRPIIFLKGSLKYCKLCNKDVIIHLILAITLWISINVFRFLKFLKVG